MNKIGTKELVQSLVDKHGLSKEDAEKFVGLMIDVLNDGLHYEKQVKIKGLGTFKVTSVAARKSVDVNTGEPIVIEGRDKIQFTPDNSLRDQVNKPFAQFETVVVNDGVDFSEIDKKYSDEDSTLQAVTEAEKAGEVSEEPVKSAISDSTATSEASEQMHETESKESETLAEDTNIIGGTIPSENDKAQSLSEKPSETESAATEHSAEKQEESEPERLILSPSQLSVLNGDAAEEDDGQIETDSQAASEEPNGASEEVRDASEDVLQSSEKADTQKADNQGTVSEEVPTDSENESQTAVQGTQTNYVEPLLHQTLENKKVLEEEDDGNLEAQMEMEMLRRQVKSNRSALKAIGISVAVLLIAAVFGIFYLLHQLNMKENRIEHLEASTQWVKEGQATPASTSTTAKPQPQQSVKNVEKVAQATPTKVVDQPKAQPKDLQASSKTKAVPAKTTSTQSVSKPVKTEKTKKETAQKQESSQLNAQYNKDVRIRTGAYNIVGIARTVTVRPGQTLSGISRSQLGPGMECYVEAVNGGRTEFKAGEKVKIPALKLKKK